MAEQVLGEYFLLNEIIIDIEFGGQAWVPKRERQLNYILQTAGTLRLGYDVPGMSVRGAGWLLLSIHSCSLLWFSLGGNIWFIWNIWWNRSHLKIQQRTLNGLKFQCVYCSGKKKKNSHQHSFGDGHEAKRDQRNESQDLFRSCRKRVSLYSWKICYECVETRMLLGGRNSASTPEQYGVAGGTSIMVEVPRWS